MTLSLCDLSLTNLRFFLLFTPNRNSVIFLIIGRDCFTCVFNRFVLTRTYGVSMSRFTIIHQSNESFICSHCQKLVPPTDSGTKNRNHCPHCLHSLHVDLRIGDRRSGCKGKMEPIGVWVRHREEWSIIHRCIKCGLIRTNRIAGDDNEVMLLVLAAKPLMSMPFPAESINTNQTDQKGY